MANKETLAVMHPCCAIMVINKYVTLSWRCCVEFMAGVRRVKKSMIWWIQCKYSGLVISNPINVHDLLGSNANGPQCKSSLSICYCELVPASESPNLQIPKYQNLQVSKCKWRRWCGWANLHIPTWPLSLAMHPRIQYLAKSSCCQWNSFLALLILVLMCLLLPKSMDLESWTQLRRIW